MEPLVIRQRELYEKIKRININFSKDGSRREKPEHSKKCLEKLEFHWREFEENNEALQTDEQKTNDYFKTDFYGLVHQFYLSTRLMITSYAVKGKQQEQDQQEESNDEDEISDGRSESPVISPRIEKGTASKTDELLKKQASNFRAFTRTVTNIDLSQLNVKWELEDVLRNLESRWKIVDSTHWELDNELEGGSNSIYEKAFTTHERTYNQVKKNINSKLWSIAHRENFTPKIDVPIFNGTYQTWVSFKDLFCEAIHNNPSMSDAQKMQFLKSKMRGEAERLIQHLSISTENYSTCWEILNNRYNNKKLIFNSHINTILELPNSKQQSVSHIKKIHDTANECLNAVKNLGVDTSSWDPLMVHLLSLKLDTQTYNDYMDSVSKKRDLPTIKDFFEFLESKFTTLESSRRKQDGAQPQTSLSYISKSSSSSSGTYYQNTNYNKFKRPPLANHVVTRQSDNKKHPISCPICGGDHGIYFCKEFIHLSPIAKQNAITKLNYCNNCLYDHHGKACFSTKKCRECNGNHNTILHDAFKRPQKQKPMNNVTQPVATNIEQQRQASNNLHVSQTSNLPEILLSTAIIKVQGMDGNYHEMRALIDQGSQLSLISERAAQMLSLPRQKCKGVVSGVGIKESNSKGQISINCTSRDESYMFNATVLVMKQLVRNLPSYTFEKPSWKYLEHIKLADPDFNISRPVDILFGADIYSNIMLEGICRSNQATPIAQQTRLGWILCGSVNTSLQCNVVINNYDQLEKFWEVEDLSEETSLSTEDFECVKFYQETTKRLNDGKYEVRLPMQINFEEELGLSKPKAIAQFLQIEKKFEKQENIAMEYKHFISEYISLQHMTPSVGNMKRECYLPHHCVLREGSTTTALRVVFNAKSQTSTGKSLNDLMARGPNLQQDLQSLILKWRQYKVAFTADIEKMFRQIWVCEDDQHLQKIIWRHTKAEPLQEYQLATVTYGTKAAPFLAMMTLKQLAKDERERYQGSSAPSVLEESFYMDDLLHGCHTLSEAKQLKHDLIKLLQSGGFNLRKWASNDPSLLQEDTEKTNQNTNYEFKQSESTKTLGLRWSSTQDHFTFELKINQDQKIMTKRSLLSEISKIFDPLGWLTPTTTKLKLLFQEIWKTELKWDDELPKEILAEWIKIRADIKNLNNIIIPRWLYTDQGTSVELHGYCDASTKAYACVIYCKVNTEPTKVVLVIAKSRVASQKKKHTLPRLELCGAELLSRVMSKVQQCLSAYDPQVYGWTDSTAVLGWIQGDPNKWKPFVSNRVKKITNIMGPESWRYVKSAENPADCASRGIQASQLLKHPLWWNGPAWLSTYKDKKQNERSFETIEEIKKTKQVNVVMQDDGDSNIIKQLINKHSSFKKIVRILAWVRRFITNKQEREITSYLTVQEKEKARQSIIKQMQHEEYAEEISNIQGGKKINTKSKILNLNPFLDESGIIRVGGRLRNANISQEMKNPIIIPHASRLTELMIEQAHELTFHGGTRLTLSYLRRKYWIVGGNRAVKKQLRSCVTCRRNKPSKHDQIMGDLPAARTNPSRPFYHTGVDFTGHVEVKANKGRGVKTTKGYIAVFMCMVTKAVHLELVSDMSSSAFLAALRRLSSRRGSPRHIYSDNGTNFVGANNILKQEMIDLNHVLDPDFYSELSDMEIEWHFQAPSWPSAGGLWEAAIKSVKYHLRRVLGEQKLTYEEFSTLLSQLEACLNSRPLCAISEDPDDLNYLTPSHFLASGPILTIVETESDQRTRWTLTQKIFNDIWQRWKVEYLAQLSTRSKWRSSKENIKLNDVVLIHDANLPAGKWSMGRVVELHPGKDGYVRVVTLKTKTGLIKRPIVKLSILPVGNQTTQATDKVEQVSAATSSDDKHDTRPRRRTCKAKQYRTSVITTVMAIMYYFTLITSCFCQNVTPLNENQGIYFDKISNMQLIRDEWKIVVYYDMYPYWDGTEAYIKYSEHLKSTCTKLQQRTHCDVIMLQLDHMFRELQYYNEILLHKQSSARQRRGLINGIGNIARSLFGVLDDEFAEKYKQDIMLINKNENYLALLWKNQTSIIEAEYNLLKRTKEDIETQHKKINQHILAMEQAKNKMQSELNNIEYTDEFILSAISAHNMIESLRETQNTLLDIITNIYNGKFNVHLITPQQLQNELNFISAQLKKELALPVNSIQADLQNIYHLLKIRAKMTDQYLIMEIRIPLISRDNYDLYHILTVPKQVGLNMVTLVPIAEYIGMNIQKDSYLPISHEELEHCILHDISTYMCYLRSPIYKMKSDADLCIKNENNQCRSKIETCGNKWLNLININTYYMFCCNICQVRAICGEHITAIQLEHANVVNMGENCVIKTENFTVYGHKESISSLKLNPEIKKLEIPQINKIINLTFEPINDISSVNEEKGKQQQQLMNDLEQKINKMKETIPIIESVSTHDIHHYSLIYVILIAVIIIAITIICRKKVCCRKQVTEASESDQEVEEEVPVALRRHLSVAKIRAPTISYDVELMAKSKSSHVQKAHKGTSPISKFHLRENSV